MCVRSNTHSAEAGAVEIERFAWMRRSTIQDAACLSFVRGEGVERVAAAFGAVVDHARTLDFDEFCEEAFANAESYSMIALRPLGEWLLVVEDNARQGTRPEVLRRASANTEVVSVFWDVDGPTRFSHAVDGEVRTAFDAFLPHRRDGTRPDALEEMRADLPWPERAPVIGELAPIGSMLALSARVTGEVLTPDCFDGDFVTYPVAEWPDDLPGPSDSVAQRPDDEHLELLAALDLADCSTRRRAALAVARRVLERAECVDHPVINRTLTALSSGRAEQAAISEAVRQWKWQVTRNRATSRVRRQVSAAEVLRQATNDNPLVAVLAALAAARRVCGVQSAELVDVASGVLATP